MFAYVCSNIFSNSQKLKTQMSIHRWMNKLTYDKQWNTVQLHKIAIDILCIYTYIHIHKEWAIDIYKYKNNYAEWNVRKNVLYNFIYINLEFQTSVMTESRSVVAWD